MRLLLDTHTLIWATLDPAALGAHARAVIEDRASERILSAASIWEMAIKIKTGKLVIPGGLAVFLVDATRELSLSILPIQAEHALLIESLHLYHTDPFDRMLIVQSMYESLAIVSIDAKFDPYGVTRIWS